LAHFGRFIAAIDPNATPDTFTRVGHIEPWLAALPGTGNTKTGGCLSRAEQARRILAVANFLSDITEWDWPQAPTRRLLFASDNPRIPTPLPRFLPPDADRRLTQALQASDNRLAADALLLQRACGLRIGELLDLELDAVIDIPASGSWLKVPLGKLDTERMVPIDDDVLALIDRITATRSPGRPIPHPRTGRPADFLFTAWPKTDYALSCAAPRPTPGSGTSPRTSYDTPTPPPWSTPGCPCKPSWPSSATCPPR
jgi:integrase